MGYFGGFICLIVLIGIVNTVIICSSSGSSKSATKTLESEKNRLRTLVNQYTDLQNQVRMCLQRDPEDSGSQVEEMIELLSECDRLRKDLDQQVSAANHAQSEAYKALSTHRFCQNMFGGGADDLGALFYYSNERKYVNASSGSVSIKEDTLLLMRAIEYVQRHPMQARRYLANQENSRTQRIETAAAGTPQLQQKSEARQSVVAFAAQNDENQGSEEKQAAEEKQIAEEKQAAEENQITDEKQAAEENQIADEERAAEEKQIADASKTAEVRQSEGMNDAEHQTADGAEETSAQVVYEATTDVRLRSEPTTDAEKLAVIREGEQCFGLGEFSEDGEWMLVSYQDLEGWTAVGYYTTVENGAGTADPDTDWQQEESSAEPQEVSSTGALSSGTAACMHGQAVVSLVSSDQGAGTITLKIQNNSNLEMRTFGLPSLIIDGRSIALDPCANMLQDRITIPAHSYAELTYYVDDAVFEDGGIITGRMHSMDPTTNSDNTYRLELCR